MRRPLKEIKRLQYDLDFIPIVIAGDIFDKWNPNPELINFALAEMPRCISVPGNHDLPYHNYKEVRKSAYWTLVEAELITNLEPGRYEQAADPSNAVFYGFPHSYPVVKRIKFLDKAHPNPLHIAVVHEYVWGDKDTRHIGADVNSHVSGLHKRLKTWGYDCAVIGDNHSSFISHMKPTLINCGAFIRRKIDEINYKPMLGLIHADGTITPYYLDTSEDLWIDDDQMKESEEVEADASYLIHELMKLADTAINFQETVERYMDGAKVSKPVREIILDAMEDLDGK